MARPASRLYHCIRWFTLFTAALLFAPMARGEDENLAALKAQIDAEVSAMKQKYEGEIHNLEKRIETLEQDNAQLKHQKTAAARAAPAPGIAADGQTVAKPGQTPTANSVVAAPLSEKQAANKEVVKKFENDLASSATETRDIYYQGWPFDVTKLYDLPRPFEFHGYLRAGFGLNGEDGKMEAFKAPGAGAKYRLGNESDTYGEVSLTNNWLRLDEPLKTPYVRTTVMLSFNTGENFSFDSLNNQAQGNDIALRQAFVEAGNVIQSMPEIRFWAGQRYYQRHDIHIDDFYYLDMSGYGAGVEDVPLGNFGKLALAWLGGSVDNYQTDHGNAAKQNIDLRVYDVPALFGKFTFWFDYSHTRGGDVHNVFDENGDPFAVQSSSGWAVGLIHRTNEPTAAPTDGSKDGKSGPAPAENLIGGILGGYNEFSIQYGTGAAYNFASTLDTSGPNLDEAWRFRVTDNFTIQPSPHFAIQAVGLYEETEFGGLNSHQRWASLGARPVYFFNDRFSVAFEAGIDWAKSEPLGTDGHLWKLTFAPQISRGGKFFSRPVIRAFITYAGWSDNFKGLVGGSAYQNETSGWSYGVQTETWW